ncbi:MAG: heme exporter protein CcmB [Gemmatimonadota bacterium]
MALSAAWAILAKDVRVELRRVESLATMMGFAALVALLFVFAGDPTPPDLARLGPGALWVSLLFAGALGFTRWFAEEERHGALVGLLAAPLDREIIFLAKWAAALVFLSLLEMVIVPATLVVYGLDIHGAWGPLTLLLFVVTTGYAALGTFFAAVAARTTAGELLLPVLLFPLSVPLLLAGAEGTQALFAGGVTGAYWDWLGLAVACDVIFGVVCTLGFGAAVEA